jgi:hypothetical protein
LIWESFTAHRPTLHRGGRRTTRPAAGRRQRAWSRVAPGHTVREPESAWWRACDEWDARRTLDEPVAVKPDEEQDEPIVTIAVVGESETGWNTDAVVLRLTELAVSDELLVVYGQAGPGRLAVMAGMRGRLPRHHIVAVDVPSRADVRRDAGAVLAGLVEDGSVPIVVTTAAAMHGVTAEISSRLEADRVVRVFRTPAGADLHQVWRRRPPEPSAN